jgi:hypothetical protein
MKCKCCGSDTRYLWTGRMLNLDVKYYECSNCGYVQTEDPFWLEAAYNSVINDSDTGIVSRNHVNSRIVLSSLWLIGGLNGNVVDYAGGYGLLVRMMRDLGINTFWTDPYCENMFAKNFNWNGSDPAKLVTAFEVFEHVVEPISTIDEMLKIAPNILLSTLVMPEQTPAHNDWWYYGQNHGQHIGFYRVKTFEKIANAKNKFLATDGVSYFLLSEKPVSNTAFKLAIRISKFMPYILKYRLLSKTLVDSKLIRGEN